MVYLLDTNILLRYVDRKSPLYRLIRDAVRRLKADGHTFVTTPQNFVEFWNVATRPIARNGFGLTPEQADRRLRRLERLFALTPDTLTVYTEWRRIVVAFGVSGVQVHDARLVAAMNVNGITHILTFNTADFARYASVGIVALDPASV